MSDVVRPWATDTSLGNGAGSIDVSDLTVEYRSGVPALTGLSLRVEPGEFIAVLGPSGCGKSTLLQCIAGLIAPTTGHARVEASSTATGTPPIGYVFQEHRLLPWRTVAQNLSLVLDAAGVATAEQDERIDRYLRMLAIERFLDSWPLKLSGGQRQRVSIARALAIHPSVVLMDEPFSTLDEVTARLIRTQLAELWAANRFTAVFVTHSIREAVFLADRVLILSRGPGRVLDEVEVDLPAPRSYDEPALRELEDAISRKVLDAWGEQ